MRVRAWWVPLHYCELYGKGELMMRRSTGPSSSRVASRINLRTVGARGRYAWCPARHRTNYALQPRSLLHGSTASPAKPWPLSTRYAIDYGPRCIARDLLSPYSTDKVTEAKTSIARQEDGAIIDRAGAVPCARGMRQEGLRARRQIRQGADRTLD